MKRRDPETRGYSAEIPIPVLLSENSAASVFGDCLIAPNPSRAFSAKGHCCSIDEKRLIELLAFCHSIGFAVQSLEIERESGDYVFASLCFGQAPDPRVKEEQPPAP